MGTVAGESFQEGGKIGIVHGDMIVLPWKTGGFYIKKWDSTWEKGGLTRVSTVDYKLFIDCVEMG